MLSLSLAALVLNCLFGRSGPRDLLRLSAERAHMIEENSRLRDENKRLEAQIIQLRTDPNYLQRMIREELGYSRPDELVYRFRVDAPPRP
jgi:cell division protein FtsB